MIFWTVALGLAGVAAALLLLALIRGREEAGAAEYDLRVYRDQMREIDKDVARGVISAEDAERARAEVGRRVLEADRALEAERAAPEAPRGMTLAAGAVAGAAVIAGTVALYLQIGAPGYPDLPMATRLAMAEDARATRPSQAEVEEQLGPPVLRQDVDAEYTALVERLRSVVAERPTDQQGLAFLARSEAALGDFVAAHLAQGRLVDLKGDAATARDFADLADMLVLAAGGYVSPEAEAALTEALKRDPTNGTARYYSGLLFAQTGRPDLAFRFWQALLAEGPPDAPWIPPIRAQIEEIAFLAGQNNFTLPPEGAPARGPSQEQVEAAGQMTAEERTQMIEGMVAGLAERLATEGGPASDWARLIRAYGVLGKSDSVAPVVEEARQVFADDPAGLAEIEAAARDAGLGQ